MREALSRAPEMEAEAAKAQEAEELIRRFRGDDAESAPAGEPLSRRDRLRVPFSGGQARPAARIVCDDAALSSSRVRQSCRAKP